MSAIFAAESQNVVTVNVEGAFLHGIMTNAVYIELDGQCVDVLIYGYTDIYTNYASHDKVYVTCLIVSFMGRSKLLRCGMIDYQLTF